MKIIPPEVGERVLSSVTMGPNGCHISTRHIHKAGYALVSQEVDGKTVRYLAHRAAWTAVHGQIPDGLTIDHMCRTRRCVNVNHLRLLTLSENGRRNHGRDIPLGGEMPQGKCQGAHPPERRRTRPDGTIYCVECETERVRQWRASNRERDREHKRRERLRRKARRDQP